MNVCKGRRAKGFLQLVGMAGSGHLCRRVCAQLSCTGQTKSHQDEGITAAYSDTATDAQLENADLIMIEEDRKKENSLNSRPTPFPRPGSTHPSLPVSDLE